MPAGSLSTPPAATPPPPQPPGPQPLIPMAAPPAPLPALLEVMTTAVLLGTTGTAATFNEGVGPLATGAAPLGIGGILQALIALPDLSPSPEHSP